MKIAIISDIHANLEALQEAKNYIDKIEDLWGTMCLGDIVGYGPNPKECLEFVQGWCKLIVKGNHDEVGEDHSQDNFNSHAKEAIEWTKNQLSETDIKFLDNLPYKEEDKNFCFVHANPYAPEDWDYVGSFEKAEYCFDYFDAPICFIGHTHVPAIILKDESGEVDILENSKYQMKEGEQCLVNVGSLGQPRDHNNQLSFCVYDIKNREIELIRLKYNYHKTQEKMKAAGFNEFLVERIGEGK